MPKPEAVSWVVCHEYAAGPFTADAAAQLRDHLSDYAARVHATYPCSYDHRVVSSGVPPTTSHALGRLRLEWDGQPGPDDDPDDRIDLTHDLAAAYLAAPLGTRDGRLTVTGGGWSAEAAARADAAGPDDSPEWWAALGRREYVILTGDGRQAFLDRDRNVPWCEHPGTPPGGWVDFEKWTADGRATVGQVCSGCRKNRERNSTA